MYINGFCKELNLSLLKKSQFNFVSLDIGARKNGGTGLAFFRNGTCVLTQQISGVTSSHEENVSFILNGIKGVIENIQLKEQCLFTVIEEPEFWLSEKGQVSAESGSFFKLVYMYGRAIQVLINLNMQIIPIKPKEWKGQLSKEQVKFRLGKKGFYYENDVADAVGLGLFVLGQFLND